ncbi:uncharacterized protein BJ212DRAFT_1583527 [Suillus subaureus]|uniref:Uncharacterized protein n=1 Tax=Suillus subaureus TaxID=48587 RepID=A0A9P7EN12_9AGAM|nr:uncharacterized protein BJ212DRAFT_1583527 [Suillus subaureus]KAG1826806.1 hypothetical protein BJ212DRAFT_1583527 [Suillus subaureus]
MLVFRKHYAYMHTFLKESELLQRRVACDSKGNASQELSKKKQGTGPDIVMYQSDSKSHSIISNDSSTPRANTRSSPAYQIISATRDLDQAGIYFISLHPPECADKNKPTAQTWLEHISSSYCRPVSIITQHPSASTLFLGPPQAEAAALLEASSRAFLNGSEMAGLGASRQTPGLRLGTSGDDLTEFEDTGTPRVWVTIHTRLSRQSHRASTRRRRQALHTNAWAVDITS